MFEILNILKPFFEEPRREFNLREFARVINKAPSTTTIKLKKLVELGIIKERKEWNLKLYKANLENDLYRDLKVFYNIRKLKESGLIDELNKYYLKPTIVLFGSCSKGIDTEDSDIDLLIISEKTKEFPNEKKFEKKLKRALHVFVVKDLKEIKNEHLINNILNGIIIQGAIRWICKNALKKD